MRVLVFNAGSSSLKFGVFDVGHDATRHLLKGGFTRIGDAGCTLAWTGTDGGTEGTATPTTVSEAVGAVPGVLSEAGVDGVEAIGHRLVHGGADFTEATRLDDDVVARIEALTPLAPLHNPANLAGIHLARRTWPDLAQFGVFDTAFHATNPAYATTYAVPAAWRATGLRRYGFHGTSHKYVAHRTAEALERPIDSLKIISVHLGNGASACAIRGGRSVDTSMGMTPLEGLVMGTRSGDVDPGLFGYLQRQLGLSTQEIEDALYSESGLKGLAGVSDMRDVAGRAAAGDNDARLALDIYAYRVRKYIGSYAAAMGGVDAVVFTGGIGENDPSMRARICDGLGFMGLRLDPLRNQSVHLGDRAAPEIQSGDSDVRVLVTETAEQLMIARETAAAAG